MSSGSKASRALVYAVVILLVVAGASFLINSRVGGIQVYDVYPTSSMLPTLEVGDLVVVQSVPYSSLHIGDVIVFAEPSEGGGCLDVVIVHRIVNITALGIYTQGDNRFTNPRADEPLSWPPVPASCVKGEVMIGLPYLGQISEAFPPPLNYILVAIIIIVVFMIELVGGDNKKEEKAPEPAKPETAPAV
ncbi:MAG: signal peptidase I [Thaumarchaeota archaeon]|nr:signal peptidase I [Nitrososphaerota archaeon]